MVNFLPLCKKLNPKVKILETKDEIPNPGYALSNKKLLNKNQFLNSEKFF